MIKLEVVLSHLLAASIALQAGLFYSQEQGPQCHEQHEQRRKQRHRRQPLVNDRTTSATDFPATMRQFIVGSSYISRDEFSKQLPLGFPLDASYQGNEKVLLWLGLPLGRYNATLNDCPTIRVMNTVARSPASMSGEKKDDHRKSICHAVIAQRHSSDDVIKFARKRYKNDHDLKYRGRFVGPGHDSDRSAIPPDAKLLNKTLKELHQYLETFPPALENLKPLAEQVANNAGSSSSTRGVVIVMVCNFGHADLLVNFACWARSNVQLDTDKILLFATDPKTHQLALALNLTSFYNENVFASIPKGASLVYGNPMYSKVMLSKVYCVHLVGMLGYDLLFHDVDIVPYQPNYLEWFVNKARTEDYDFYFQHAYKFRNVYSPWLANSGLYYVRANDKTRYFWSSLLVQGDKILVSHSHQAALHTVLSQHSTLYGLRIKTLNEENELVPNGWHYHYRPDFMRDMIRKGKGNNTPAFNFHHNFNMNKPEKVAYMEQFGDWRVRDPCVDDKLGTTLRFGVNKTNGWIYQKCCAAKPLVKCHYRDKPSVIPCKDSPPFEANATSFW